LPANGAIFIGRIDKIEKVWRDGQSQLVIGQPRACIFLGRERRHEALQLLDVGDPMLKLPTPIVPVRFGNVAPEATARRTELFKRVDLR